MRYIVCALVLSFIVVLPLPGRAQDGVVTLQELEQEALQNNPDIRMSDKKAESAEEKRTVVSAMPDPMIGYMVQNVGSPFTWSVGQQDMSMQGVVVSQTIPFPGKLSTVGHAAEKAAERETENAREQRLRVLADLRNAYYDYYLAFRSADILVQTKDFMKNFEKIAETRYATGRGMQQDILRAQLEISLLLDRLAEEDRKKETQSAMINKLVGRDPLAPLGRPADLPRPALVRSVDELAAMARAHSPLLAARERTVEQGEFEVSSRKRDFLPDMVLSGGWFTRGDKPEVWQASVMFKVPLYFWNKSAGVREADADLSSARYGLEAARLQVLARVRDLYATIKTSEHHLELYAAGILPQARLSLESTTANYQVGKTDFLTLLESENMLLRYQLMEQEEIVKLNKMMAMMHELTGEDHHEQ